MIDALRPDGAVGTSALTSKRAGIARYAGYWLLIVLPIWQDSPLSGPLGAYGYSIVPLISLIAGVSFIVLHARNRLLQKGTFTGTWWRLVAWLVIVNVMADAIWLLLGNPATLRGESILSKSVKGLVTAVSIGCYLLVTTYVAKKLDEERATRPFFHAFLILAVVALVEYPQMPEALPWAHYAGMFPYYRPRLLTTESSWTTLLIVVYGGISLHYCFKVAKRRVWGFICITAWVFLLATTGSRSFMILAIAGVVVGLVALIRRDARWILLAVALCFFVILFPGVFDRLATSFQTDMDQFTSLATRSFTGIVAFVCSIVFPVGTGNALYLQIFPDMLQRFSDLYSDLGLDLNMSEVNSYINSSTDVNMSAKAALLQYGIYWGIVGTVVVLRALWREGSICVKDRRFSLILLVTYVAAVLGITLSATFDSQYEFFALMVLLEYYVGTREASRDAQSSP